MLTPHYALKAFLFVLLSVAFCSCEKDSDIRKADETDSIKSVDGAFNQTQNAKKGTQEPRNGGGKPTTTVNYTLYTIPKGEHSSDLSSFKSLFTNSLKFEAVFDKSAIYDIEASGNQGDINKLYGMSDCSSHHQTNSARFGWRWYENNLEIWAYVYHNETRAYEKIGTIAIDKPYQYELLLEGENYVFRLSGFSDVVLPRGCSGTGVGYQLYPYFGGDEVAPHDITIRIRNL